MHDSSTAMPDTGADFGHELPANDPALAGMPCPPAHSDHRWLLQRDATGHLQVMDRHKPKQRGLRIELGSRELQRRIAAGRQQPLARACGMHKGGNPVIHDWTTGLCRDAWCLAALGARISAYERHPVLFALLRDALSMANTEVSRRITPQFEDARTANGEKADVLFLDPMFPSTGKRAAPGLEMQIMQDLVGADDDAQGLLQAALNSGAPRVVLKRPPRGAKVRLGEPDISFGGGRVVYDVYLSP